MDELKLVLETLATMADGAKEAFIWWLIATKGLNFLIWIGGFWMVVKIATIILVAVGNHDKDRIILLLEMFGYSARNAGYGPYYSVADFQRVLEEIRKLKEKK